MLAVSDCLVVGILHFFGQFRGQRKVLALVKIHQVRNYFPKKSCSTVKLFFFFKYVLYQTVLSKYLKKNRVSPCLFPHKLPRKVDMVLRSQPGWRICAVGTGTRHKMVPIVFETCSSIQELHRPVIEVKNSISHAVELKRLADHVGICGRKLCQH